MPTAPPFEAYHNLVAQAIVQAGLTPVFAEDMDHPRAVRDQISRGMSEAAICVVDLTGRGPIAIYVLGLAHGLGRPVVQLAQSEYDLPFDLRLMPHIIYRPGTARWEDMLSLQLQRAVRETLAVSSGTIL